MYFAFPGGMPGSALLLLRTIVGMSVLLQGGYCIAEPQSTTGVWCIGLLALIAGALLVFGFLTPLAGGGVAAAFVAAGFSLLPSCKSNIFDSRASLLFGFTMVVAIVGLGPGLYSMDARIFGRREIIIPPPMPGRR